MSYGLPEKSTKAAVSVGVTATLLINGNRNRYVLYIVNEGASKVYLGDVNVTSTTGMPLQSGSIWPDYDTKDAWYAITASGTADIRLMEVTI